MDEIRLQLSEIIRQRNNVPSETAELLAVREIVLSGLSRCGFLKEFPYLTKFDHHDGEKYYLFFLNQNPAAASSQIASFIPFIEIEFKAFGIHPEIAENKNGFVVKDSGKELSVFIISEDFDLTSVISYHAEPLSYEMRSIDDMNEGTRSSIEKIIDKEIKKIIPNKNGAVKAPSKNKRNKKSDDSVQQLSLFDI